MSPNNYLSFDFYGERITYNMNVKILKDAGVDYNAGLDRFVNNADLYERMLHEFIRENEFGDAETALESNDLKSFGEHIHTMKGVTGNLSITPLFEKCCLIMTLIHEGKAELIPVEAEITFELYKAVAAAIKAAEEN